jgi:hypothetical protein
MNLSLNQELSSVLKERWIIVAKIPENKEEL